MINTLFLEKIIHIIQISFSYKPLAVNIRRE